MSTSSVKINSNEVLLPKSCAHFRHRSPHRSPLLAAIIRRHSNKNDYPKMKYKEQRRVVVLGSAKVGKSAIIWQFLYDKFLTRYRKTVEDLYLAEYKLPGGASLTLEILDTAGSFRFPAMRALSISTAGAFLLVYAVDNEESWEEVKQLREQIIEARGADVPIVVVGNKIDIGAAERKCDRESIEEIVTDKWQCGYIECSAKDNISIVEVFEELLVQAKIRYNLSLAVRRRRQSLPVYSGDYDKSNSATYSIKRNSCSIS